MRPKRRWNERTRLILTLELAVVLPAAALAWISTPENKVTPQARGGATRLGRDRWVPNTTARQRREWRLQRYPHCGTSSSGARVVVNSVRS
jgi:hypothetical protein